MSRKCFSRRSPIVLERRVGLRHCRSSASSSRPGMERSGIGVRIPATTSSPCAFGSHSPKKALAGRRIARERDARRARVAQVAEHHRLDVARRAPALRDVVHLAATAGAGSSRVEDGADRAPELLPFGSSGNSFFVCLLTIPLKVWTSPWRSAAGMSASVTLRRSSSALRRVASTPSRFAIFVADRVERVLEVLALHAERHVSRTSPRSGDTRRRRSAGCPSSPRAPSPSRRSGRGSGWCPSCPASRRAPERT